MAFFSSLLGVGGALAGGIFGGGAAGDRNDAIVANAYAQQEALNENINRARLSFFDAQRTATGQFQRSQGNASNALFAGFRSGYSLNRLLAADANDFMRDDLARKRNLAQTIENIETQKANIARQASAQTQSVGLATVMGGLQGFSMGSSIGGSIDNAVSSMKDSAFLKDLNEQYAFENSDQFMGPPNPNLQAQMRAVSSGVSPSMLREFPGIATAPFAQQIATQGIGLQAAQLGLQQAQQQFGFSQFLNQNALFNLGGLR